MYMAAQNGHHEFIEALIGYGCSVSAKSHVRSPVGMFSHGWVSHPCLCVVFWWLPTPSFTGEKQAGASPLMIACQNGHTECVKSLAAEVANINETDLNVR